MLTRVLAAASWRVRSAAPRARWRCGRYARVADRTAVWQSALFTGTRMADTIDSRDRFIELHVRALRPMESVDIR
jgi:hypothetical protein